MWESISRFAQLMSRKDRIRNKAFTFLDAVEQSKAICWSKFNLQSIVTPRSLTKFFGFKMLLPILNSNWLESLIPKNMTWNFAGLAAIELKLNHSKVCEVFLEDFNTNNKITTTKKFDPRLWASVAVCMKNQANFVRSFTFAHAFRALVCCARRFSSCYQVSLSLPFAEEI